ncbi:hypothetical protein [Leadbettera azotonutricia]|uniref:Uncharacterized protein n=1 Tax=Leadbettera azotonutricia (strain ATCC BAA-888 / DSM 13862 / ZAS-9) TaxID=545695 RepID=F5YBI7_LEAAZ|nr:hypothetical protein [Leadbettera azotonutricia]AEF81632.1 hypothetical protein TREAZ_0596 [Leadbettera azotonutricia ZAS-9]
MGTPKHPVQGRADEIALFIAALEKAGYIKKWEYDRYQISESSSLKKIIQFYELKIKTEKPQFLKVQDMDGFMKGRVYSAIGHRCNGAMRVYRCRERQRAAAGDKK